MAVTWKIAGVVLLLLLCTAGCVTSPPPAESGGPAGPAGTPAPLAGPDAAVSRNLDAYMTALAESGRFSGAVHAARGTTVLLSKGYGMANYEFSAPNTPQTVFPIGSNTKQLTAAAIMKLQEQGRLNLTDPVTLYLPNATEWKEIRIYQLLNHTAGIPSDGAFPLTDPADLTLPEIMERAAALPLTFAPGSNHTYSNNGYIALSAVIEQASGVSYDEYLATNLFRPLGMNGTGQDNARDVFPGRASGYTTMGGSHIHYDLQNIHNSWGAGSIHSTTEDLFRWERAFHTPGAILSPQSAAAMVENHYGIESGVLKNRTINAHGGRNFGFISHTLYYPEEDVSIIFLSNHDRTPMVTLTNDLSAIVFGEPYALPQTVDRKAAPLTASAAKDYIGTYEPAWERSWTITVYPGGDRLFYRSVMPGETVELFYEGNDTFFLSPESNDAFIFTRNASGKVDGLNMYTLEGSYDRSEKVS